MTMFFIQSKIAEYYGYGTLAKHSSNRLRFVSDYIFDGTKCIKHRTCPKPTRSQLLKSFEGVIFTRPLKNPQKVNAKRSKNS